MKRYYLYQTFAILWIFPCLGGVILAWPIIRLNWREPGAALELITVEQWIALLLIGLQFIFAFKTWEHARLLKAERPTHPQCRSTNTSS